MLDCSVLQVPHLSGFSFAQALRLNLIRLRPLTRCVPACAGIDPGMGRRRREGSRILRGAVVVPVVLNCLRILPCPLPAPPLPAVRAASPTS